jgi:hypothetical protein
MYAEDFCTVKERRAGVSDQIYRISICTKAQRQHRGAGICAVRYTVRTCLEASQCLARAASTDDSPRVVARVRCALKVPKREIFDRSDFPDFYTMKSLRVGDFGVKIKKNLKNILGFI